MTQLLLAALSLAALYLVTQEDDMSRRLASVFGLASQPFWMWSAVSTRQWGMAVVCSCYCVIWAKRFWLGYVVPAIRRRWRDRE